mgnify:CR=1 FL=1
MIVNRSPLKSLKILFLIILILFNFLSAVILNENIYKKNFFNFLKTKLCKKIYDIEVN